MPRTTTVTELTEMSNAQFNKLWEIINAMNDEQQCAAFCFDAKRMGSEAHWKRDKNLRDVLIHLYEWHQLFLKWEDANSKGANAAFLPAPYNWKTYGDMNMEFWKKHQSTALESAKEMLLKSHRQVMAVIEKYNNEELFVKKYFKWTGTSSLGQYCISTTISHYDWAIKKIKAQIKACKELA